MKTVLNKALVRWDDIEAVITAMCALNKNIMLIGKHGIGKTTLGKILGIAYGGEDQFVMFPCDKANEFDICGLPDISASKAERRNVYIEARNTIWGKKVIVLDELTRANREQQNLWLEVVEEKTARGNPLEVEMIIATCNPETYKGTFKLDDALMDRFYAVVNVPDITNHLEEETLDEMIEANLTRETNLQEIGRDFKALLKRVKDKYEGYLTEQKTMKYIKSFVSKFLSVLIASIEEKDELRGHIYISPRTLATQFIQVLLGCSAYYDALGRENPFRLGAEAAIRYSIVTKHRNEGLEKIVHGVFRDFSLLLMGDPEDPATEIRIKATLAQTPDQKIEFFADYLDDLLTHFDPEEYAAITSDACSKMINKQAFKQVFQLVRMMRGTPLDHIAEEAEGNLVGSYLCKLIKMADQNSDEPRDFVAELENNKCINLDHVQEVLTTDL